MISGEYTEFNENESLVLKWRMKDWKADDYCVVEIVFSDSDGNCDV